MQTPDSCIEAVVVAAQIANGFDVVLLDVRSEEERAARPLPSALHIPLEQLKDTASQFDKTKLYIAICNHGQGPSLDAAELLQMMGYNASWICGGLDSWEGIV